MRSSVLISIVSASVLVVAVAAFTAFESMGGTAEPSKKLSLDEMSVQSNEEFINGLYAGVDLNDPKAVFGLVFGSLRDEVTVYPSENYYYFKLSAAGRTINGCITLYPSDRDNGILGFGYVRKIEDKARQKDVPIRGKAYDFTRKDGLYLRKIDDFKYSATYKGKTVVFNLYDKPDAPRKAKLRDDEVFVGPSFDESGLRFFLIFNKTTRHLYWILNEEGFVPENFRSFTDDILIGDRTEFAFYADSVNDRKILVGVEGLNVLQNNWYDGPFDQMPDNYVRAGRVKVREYLEADYGYPPGSIDEFGRYVGDRGSRIPVAPYKIYFSKEDLRFVDSCRATNLSPSEFYTAITRQVFDVAEDQMYH